MCKNNTYQVPFIPHRPTQSDTILISQGSIEPSSFTHKHETSHSASNGQRFCESTDLACLWPLTAPWPLVWVRRLTGHVWLPSVEPVALASASPTLPSSAVDWRISAVVIQCLFSAWFWLVQWRKEGKGSVQGASRASSLRWDSGCSLQGNNQALNIVLNNIIFINVAVETFVYVITNNRGWPP